MLKVSSFTWQWPVKNYYQWRKPGVPGINHQTLAFHSQTFSVIVKWQKAMWTVAKPHLADFKYTYISIKNPNQIIWFFNTKLMLKMYSTNEIQQQPKKMWFSNCPLTSLVIGACSTISAKTGKTTIHILNIQWFSKCFFSWSDIYWNICSPIALCPSLEYFNFTTAGSKHGTAIHGLVEGLPMHHKYAIHTFQFMFTPNTLRSISIFNR